MGTWFDGLAKRSARADIESAPPSGSTGLTRRQVIIRGAAVTGAAWTAPVLMSAFTAAAAASPLNCPPNTFETACPRPNLGDGITPGQKEALCCPDKQSCGFVSANIVGCVRDGDLGGQCKNSGNGQCAGNGQPGNPRARCNGKTDPNLCGGLDASCGGGQGEVCAPGFTCVLIPNAPAGGDGTCQPT